MARKDRSFSKVLNEQLNLLEVDALDCDGKKVKISNKEAIAQTLIQKCIGGDLDSIELLEKLSRTSDEDSF
ncbi:MAG: hypothetical protein NC548_49985 [Lachnospiraceae bacterium]|nr:hypothetical protein [Lachnospiraceae bacterium]